MRLCSKEMTGAPTRAWSGDARDGITKKCVLFAFLFLLSLAMTIF
jgi:hypothetical protein